MPDSQERDQQILNRLASIEQRVDSIDQTSAFALRAEEDKHKASVKKIFGTSKRRAQVYLATNGHRGVEEIGTHLGMHRQHVGADLQRLQIDGLLEPVARRGNKDIWARKALDRTLRISAFLQEHFELTKDGKPVSGKKKGKKKAKRATKRKRR